MLSNVGTNTGRHCMATSFLLDFMSNKLNISTSFFMLVAFEVF